MHPNRSYDRGDRDQNRHDSGGGGGGYGRRGDTGNYARSDSSEGEYGRERESNRYRGHDRRSHSRDGGGGYNNERYHGVGWSGDIRTEAPLSHQKRTSVTVDADVAIKRAKSDWYTEAPRDLQERPDSISIDLSEEEKANRKAYQDCLRDCDKQLDRVPNQAHQVPIGWNEKKNAAVNVTLEKLSDIRRSPDDSDDGCSSSDDSYARVCSQAKPTKGLTQAERKFVMALQYCLPVDAGFHVQQSKASHICFCPCGPNLLPWREEHRVDVPQLCTKSTFAPNDLMDHLKREGGMFEERESNRRRVVKRPLTDILHYAVRIYLQILYKDWNGTGHKALYPRLTKEFKRAEDEETRLLEREILVGRAEIRRQEEEKAKLKAKLQIKKKKIKQFRDLAKDHQKKIEQLEAIRKKLDVSKKAEENLTDGKIAKFDKMLSRYFDAEKKIGGLKDVKITVMGEAGGSGFSLQQFFDTLYPKKGVDAQMALFSDGKGGDKIVKMILSEWKIIYDKTETYASKRKKDARARKAEDTGVDEGGPSRQFITDIFKQLDSLSITFDHGDNRGHNRVKLFEDTQNGVILVADDTLREGISNAAKISAKNNAKEEERLIKEATKKATDYSRAVGRVMLHALAHKQTLPSNAISNFFINVMLRGYGDDYHKDDILKHITELGFDWETILKWLLDPDSEERDEHGNKWTKETFFSKWVPTQFINTRKILLGSLRDGLTIGGNPKNDELVNGCGLSDIFSIVPLEAIRRLYFGKPEISLKDLLGVVEPKFGEGDPNPLEQMSEADKKKQVIAQRIFFSGDFKKFLEESSKKDNDFLVKFVECASGRNYLPYDKNFKINIEFNFSLDAISLPKFHACTFDVVFPGFDIFFGDYNKFKETMDFVIPEVYNQFHMK